VTNSSGINHQEGDSKKETLLSARTQEPKYEVNANEYNFDNDYDLDCRDMVDVEIDEEDVPLVPPRKKKFKKANDDPTFDPKSEPISLSDTPKIHKKSANCKKNLTEKRGRGRPRKDHKGEACLNIHGLNDDYGKPLFESPSEYYYFPATGERDSKKEFHCHKCARSFEYSHQLTQHLYRHESGNLNQDKAWFCDLCDGKARFKSPMELIDHKSQSHDGYKKCDRCYGLIDLGDIQSKKHHKKLACDDATLFCVSCGLKTTHENNLKTHVKNHGGHEFHSNKCAYTEECPDVTFELWMDHLHHIRTKHNCIQKVKCKFCPESFFTDDEKKEHVRMTHKGNVIIAPDGERDTSLKFQCPRCIKGFEYKYLLNEHLLIHDAQAMAENDHDPSSTACPFCAEKFDSSEDLNDHKLTVHYVRVQLGAQSKTDKFKCLQCDKEIQNQQFMEWHIRKRHPKAAESKKECIICGKLFLKQDVVGYNNHMSDHGKYELHDRNKCPLCPGVRFYTFQDRKEHVLKFHEGKFVTKCPHCPQIFDTEEERHQHEREAHPPDGGDPKDKEKAPCEYCGKVLLAKFMRVHVRNTHMAGDKKWPCQQCPSVFTSETRLHHHINMVHKEVPCEVCGESVKVGGLQRHRSRYHDPKVECDQCGESVPAYRLKLHKKSHWSEDQLPFKCSFCSKGFLQKNKLVDHENMHRGEKPHKCDQCGLGYADRGNLNAHIKTVHLGIKRKQKRA